MHEHTCEVYQEDRRSSQTKVERIVCSLTINIGWEHVAAGGAVRLAQAGRRARRAPDGGRSGRNNVRYRVSGVALASSERLRAPTVLCGGRYTAELILGQPPALDLEIFAAVRILENRPAFRSHRKIIEDVPHAPRRYLYRVLTLGTIGFRNNRNVS